MLQWPASNNSAYRRRLWPNAHSSKCGVSLRLPRLTIIDILVNGLYVPIIGPIIRRRPSHRLYWRVINLLGATLQLQETRMCNLTSFTCSLHNNNILILTRDFLSHP